MLTIFLDRDGTINRKQPEGDYVKSWAEFEFLPGALAGIRLLARTGARIICITNQRGIARGRMTEVDLADIHQRMLAEIRQAGGRVDAIYHCPHEGDDCNCRKPLTGMFEQAKLDFPDIDFANSFMVGDALSDMKAASRLGCKSALVSPVDADMAAAVIEEARRQGIRIDVCVSSLEALARSAFGIF